MKNVLIFLGLFFSLSFGVNSLYAQDVKQGLLNKLLAPGPLMEGHKKLEKVDCLSCHDAGKGVPNDKCLECHKEIKQSVAKKTTYHATVLQKKACIECHTDHKGRENDSTKVDPKTFNHDLTGHTLHGKHKEIKCQECHKETRAKMSVRKEDMHFMGLTTTCKSCHQKNDVHLFQEEFAKKDCNACHNEVKWKDVKSFDHFKESKYKIEGKHTELSCAKCHTPNGDKVGPSVYKWESLQKDECLACHKPYHKDVFSEKYNNGKCQTCHNQTTWKMPKFDHKITGFILNGKHAETDCKKCHIQKDPVPEVTYKIMSGIIKLPLHKWIGLKTQCISCHKDIHLWGGLVSNKFGNLEKCQTCHNERKFKEGINFNHNLDTRFKIDGKHIGLVCLKCHLNSIPENKDSPRIYQFKELEKDNCVICHKSPHLKSFSQNNLEKRCTTCHITTTWKETRKNDKFNHNIDTKFALEGKHAMVQCKDCHKEGDNKVFKFNFAEKQYCEACHVNVHLKQFSEKFTSKSCLECHNVSSFKDLKKFDHNKTNFALDGKHAATKVMCVDCHKSTGEFIQYKGANVRPRGNFKFNDDGKGRCEACHTNVHINQFTKTSLDKACTSCHSTQTFQSRKPFDHGSTKFPLIGFHEKIDCIKCHTKSNETFPMPPKNLKHKFDFGNTSTDNCRSCHKDPHKGEFGNTCKDCHSESKKWKLTQNFHKDFLLNGIHYTLKCNECHKEQRRLGGMSESCIMCHKKDDRHHGSLPNCKDCHKQEFWEVTTFKHSRTSFPLKGMHRTLSCDECHSSGLYQGKSGDCYSCHNGSRSDVRSPPATISTGTTHGLLLGTDCAKCHNQFAF